MDGTLCTGMQVWRGLEKVYRHMQDGGLCSTCEQLPGVGTWHLCQGVVQMCASKNCGGKPDSVKFVNIWYYVGEEVIIKDLFH